MSSKRLSRDSDRDFARRIADLYESGDPCIPVDVDDERLRPLDGDDLAMLLRSFATVGTWDDKPGRFRRLLIRAEYRRLQKEGCTRERAIERLMAEYQASADTIEGYLYRRL